MPRRLLVAPALAALGIGILAMHGLTTTGVPDGGYTRPVAMHTTPHTAPPAVPAGGAHSAPDRGGLHPGLGACLWILTTAAALTSVVRPGRPQRARSHIRGAVASVGAVLSAAGPAPPPDLSPARLGVSRR